MRKEDKQLLRGIALGDGGLVRSGPNKATLTLAHSMKQYAYFRHKHDILERIFGKDIKITEYKINIYDCVRLHVTDQYLALLLKWLYTPRKTLTLNYLRKVSNHGVAIWYLDDGSLCAKRRRDKVHAYDLTISIYGTESEATDAIAFMKERFDAEFTLKRNKGKFSIRCGTMNAKKFLSQVDMHIPDCMSYKTFRLTGGTLTL